MAFAGQAAEAQRISGDADIARGPGIHQVRFQGKGDLRIVAGSIDRVIEVFLGITPEAYADLQKNNG